MRFWGRHRGRELKCISASSPPPLCMLNISGICTRLYMTGGDLDCLGENRPYPHRSWQSKRALHPSKNSSDRHMHTVTMQRHNGCLARWQADTCTSRKPRWKRIKVKEWWKAIRLPLSHLESYLIVLRADPSPILRYMTESLAWKSATVAEYSFPSKKKHTQSTMTKHWDTLLFNALLFLFFICPDWLSC